MRKHCSQLVLMVIMSVVATALARAQDITVRSTQPFSAGAAFTGFFSSESDHGTDAMLGGFGYTAISRLLLGGPGGAS